jgi:hypothetical protein
MARSPRLLLTPTPKQAAQKRPAPTPARGDTHGAETGGGETCGAEAGGAEAGGAGAGCADAGRAVAAATSMTIKPAGLMAAPDRSGAVKPRLALMVRPPAQAPRALPTLKAAMFAPEASIGAPVA